MSLSNASKKNKESNQQTDDELLKRHEGSRLKAYQDTSKNRIWTIGYGHNIEADDGFKAIGRHLDKNSTITPEEQEKLYQYDKAKVEAGLNKNIKGYDELKPKYKSVLTNMAFNMGVGGVAGFPRMLKGMREDNPALVAESIRDSKYYRDVKGKRAEDLISIAEGKTPSNYESSLAKIKHDTSGMTLAETKEAINKTAGVVGSVFAVRNTAVRGALSTFAGKIAGKIAGKVFEGNEDVLEKNKKSEEQTLTISIKQSKKIAYDTAGLTGWHKRVIELMTDWANKGRDNGRNGTVSIKQAVIESGNKSSEATEQVDVKETDKDAKQQPETESTIFGNKTTIEQKLRWLAVSQAARNDTVISGIEAIEKNDSSKFKTPSIFKAITGKLDTPVKENPSNIDSFKPQKSISNAIVYPQYKTPDIVNSQPIKSINNAVVNKPIIKEIPAIKQSSEQPNRKQIIINNTENVEEANQQTVYLFPEKYDARAELKQLWIEGKDIGHGLRTGVH